MAPSPSLIAGKLARRSEAFAPGLRRSMMTAAAGMDDVIALARGDPDSDTPAHIIAAGKAALDTGWTHYTPWIGLPELRALIADKLQSENGIAADPATEIAVTGGAQEALFVALQVLLDPGDEVLLPDPHYSAYDGAIALTGATAVLVPTRGERSFELSRADLEPYVTPRTKLLVLVDPSNPAGAVLSRQAIEEIALFACEHDLVVIADEVYEKLVYDGRTHISIASLPQMRDRTVTLFSFSKSYAMTGWRIGYFVGPPDFVARAAELHYVVSICASAPAQRAAIEALRGPQDHIAEMKASYVMRRDLLISELERLGLPCVRPHGGFTVMVDVRGTGMGSVEFCRHLLNEAHVQVFPGTMYGPGGEGYVRMSVLAPPERLEEAIRRIGAVLPVSTS